jgi:Na+/H+-translocating membrane pyrophosphatase
MEFVIPGCVLSCRARLSAIFVVAIVAHVIAAACIFLGKDKPSQMLVDLLVALVWIVIRMVSQCRERTSLRTARSDGEPNTENDVNTKTLAENDDAERI